MVWSAQDKERAASENWELVDTVDRDTLQLRVYGTRGMSNADSMRYVWDLARRGSEFHRRALQVVTSSLKTIKRGKK